MKRTTPEKARAIALELIERRHPRPVLVGEVCLEIGDWSLTQAEGLVFRLGLEKLIRPATPAEKQRYDVRGGWVWCSTKGGPT